MFVQEHNDLIVGTKDFPSSFLSTDEASYFIFWLHYIRVFDFQIALWVSDLYFIKYF